MDRLLAVVAVAAMCFLAFVGGSVATLGEAFPSGYIEAAYRGGMALWQKKTAYPDIHRTDFWKPERSASRGVTIHDEGRADAGHVLYTSGHGTNASLIARNGDVLHEWELPFSRIWDESAAVKDPRPDAFMYWRKAHVFPNGDLLAIYVAAGDTPWGYGMVKLDADSGVRWRFLEQTHHGFDVGDDGRIYALTHAIESKVYERFRHLRSPHLEDYVVVLSPEGEVLDRVSIIEAFVNGPYGRMLANVRWYTMNSGDYIHTNDVEVIDADVAARLPFAEPGQVLVSMREINTVAVIDLDRKAVVWAVTGNWIGQHDPDPLANGNLLLFDNLGRYDGGRTNRSRILEINPVTQEIVWSYQGTEESPFDSDIRGAQVRVPNGNTLITESSGGRILEVSPGGEVVWEYWNPVRHERDAGSESDAEPTRLIPVVSWADRVDPGVLTGEWLAR